MFNDKKLFQFLTEHEKEIIQLCRDKVSDNSESKPTSALLDQGLPVFYKELIEVLKRTTGAPVNADHFKNNTLKDSASEHGKESLRLGYTISQVVHAYGAVCQSITEFVQTKGFKIQSPEFHDLNLALDCAIAEAVTEFSKAQGINTNNGEVERLGFLIHELGNSLAAASVAHQMMQQGQVGAAGITSQVLSRGHDRMRHLIESSLAEIRMRGHVVLEPSSMRLIDILSEVEATAMIMRKSNDTRLEIDVSPEIQFTADRHMMFSALSNLVNNAMKFTPNSGKVSVRAKESGKRVFIEVQDECGGLPEGKIEDLFKPFVQKGADKTGMGLGLSLSRQAIELNHGKLTAHNISGKGCVFTIDLPADKKIFQNAA